MVVRATVAISVGTAVGTFVGTGVGALVGTLVAGITDVTGSGSRGGGDAVIFVTGVSSGTGAVVGTFRVCSAEAGQTMRAARIRAEIIRYFIIRSYKKMSPGYL
jgi:hypothetical protein